MIFKRRKRTTETLAGLWSGCACTAMLTVIGCCSGSAQVASSAAPAVSSDKIAQTIYLISRLGGLYPQSLTVQEGIVRIVLANPTFAGTLEFVVSDEPGKRLLTTSAGADGTVKSRHAISLTLTPGKYTIYVLEHPEWNSTLTVTQRSK